MQLTAQAVGGKWRKAPAPKGRKKSYETTATAYKSPCVTSFKSRSRNSCTSSAIAYFNASIPLPVTAEISYNFNFFFLQYFFRAASLSLFTASIFDATMIIG